MVTTPLGLVQLLLILGAFVIAVLSGIGKAPLWPAVLLLAVSLLLVVSLR
jgi:hypothetical protein